MKKVVLTIGLLFILSTASMLFAASGKLIGFVVQPDMIIDEAQIVLTFEYPSDISITLLDDTQTKVLANIYKGTADKGENVYNWDRTDSDGNKLPGGKYYVSVTSFDKYTSVKKTVILK